MNNNDKNNNFEIPNNINLRRVIELTDEFLKIPSVIGFEQPFLKYLNEKILTLGYKTELKKDNLIVKSKFENKNNLLFSAHIDRHGLIKNENNEFEYIAYNLKKKFNLEFKKDIRDFYLSACQRHIKDEVYSYNIKNGNIIDEAKIERFNLNWKSKLVTYDLSKQIQDNVLGFYSTIKMTKNLFYGQIDNVISVAVLIYLLEIDKINGDIIFTTQEEIGFSYKNVINYLDENKINKQIITLDTSPYDNFDDKCDGFIVLRKGDENGDFNLDLVKKIENLAINLMIPFEYKSNKNGMTELGRISTVSKGKYTGTTLQIPSMNYHTTYETSTLSSLENYIKLIIKLQN